MLKKPKPSKVQLSIGGDVQDSVIIFGDNNTVVSPVRISVELSSVRTDTESIEHPFFVSRDEEIRIIQSSWGKVKKRKRLQFVLVEGMPGAGKTTLVEMFLKKSVGSRFPFYQVKCIDKNVRTSLIPFQQIISQSDEELAFKIFGMRLTGTDPQQKQADAIQNIEMGQIVKFNSILKHFNAQAVECGGLVLFFDDVQWMDETSISLLEHMRDTGGESPILIVLAYRRTETKNRLSIFKSIYKLGENFPLIQIPDAINVFEYIQIRYSENNFDQKLVKRIQSTTKGNAFFIHNFFNYLEREGILYKNKGKKQWETKNIKIKIPDNIWMLIEQQLSSFDSETFGLLKFASVEGETFTIEILSRLMEIAPMEVEAALLLFKEVEIINKVTQPDEGNQNLRLLNIHQYQFTHSLYREYFYLRKTEDIERETRHGQMAKVLHDFYEGNLAPVSAQLAVHYKEAHDYENALDFGLMAGEFDQKHYNWQQGMGWSSECKKLIEVLKEESIDPVRYGRFAVLWANGVEESMSELKISEGFLKKAIARLDDVAHARIKCEALIALSYAQYEIGTPSASETGKMAVQLARTINDVELLYEANGILSDVLVDNEEDFVEGEIVLKEAIRIADDLQDPYKQAESLADYAWMLTDLGKTDEAYEYAKKAVNIIELEEKKLTDVRLKAFVYRMAAIAYQSRVEPDQVIELFKKSLSAYEDLGDKIKYCWVLYDMGKCYMDAHNFDMAVNYFENQCLVNAKKIKNKDTILWSLVSLADIDLAENRVELAADRLAEAGKIMKDPERQPTPQDVMEYRISLSYLKYKQGDVAAANRLAFEVIKEANVEYHKYAAYLNLGKFSLEAGDLLAAKTYFLQSADVASSLQNPIWLANCHEGLGDLFQNENDPFASAYHYRQSLKKIPGYYHQSGTEKIDKKFAEAKKNMEEKLSKDDNKLISLDRDYVACEGQITISHISRDIFLKPYFTYCLECGFCNDSCCSYGVDIDVTNVNRIKDRRDEILPFIRQTDQEWFEPELKYDAEFPGNQFTRTNVFGGRCIFISKDQRGCGLHRYAVSKGIDYHTIKPIVCSLFPVTFGDGILYLSTELEDGSLECSGNGPTAYRGVRDELLHYFGSSFVQKLDEIEKNVLSKTYNEP